MYFVLTGNKKVCKIHPQIYFFNNQRFYICSRDEVKFQINPNNKYQIPIVLLIICCFIGFIVLSIRVLFQFELVRTV